MKKISKIALAIILALTLLLGVTACNKDKGTTEGVKSVTIIMADINNAVLTTINCKTEALYLEGLVAEISQNAEYKTTFVLKDSSYGKFIGGYTVNGISYPTAADIGAYVMCYTSIIKVAFIMPGTTITVDGNLYNCSGLGISTMPVVDNATYVFNNEVFKG